MEDEEEDIQLDEEDDEEADQATLDIEPSNVEIKTKLDEMTELNIPELDKKTAFVNKVLFSVLTGGVGFDTYNAFMAEFDLDACSGKKFYEKQKNNIITCFGYCRRIVPAVL